MSPALVVARLGVVMCITFGALVAAAYAVVGVRHLAVRVRTGRDHRTEHGPWTRYGFPHNALAHPLLPITELLGRRATTVGTRFHNRTRPEVPTRAGRRLLHRHPGIVFDTPTSFHIDPPRQATALRSTSEQWDLITREDVFGRRAER